MVRLLVHVEGQTEETFVNHILAPHLVAKGFADVSARMLGNYRSRGRRGGIKGWLEARKDIVRHLQGDGSVFATTMVDYYALPAEGEKAWPGRANAAGVAHPAKANVVQAALLQDVTVEMGGDFQARRFIPFVMMHEFEALLFSDCRRFATGIAQSSAEPILVAIRAAFATPEHINDSPTSAPSKRIAAAIPSYRKVFHGKIGAEAVGIDSMRAQCANFAAWLTRLESLVSPGPVHEDQL